MSDSQIISNFAGIVTSFLFWNSRLMKLFIVSEKIKQQLNAYFSYGILKCQAILKISFFGGETEVKYVKCYSRFRATPNEAFSRRAPFSSPEPQCFFLNCWTRGSGTIQKYLFFHWLSKTLCAIRWKVPHSCALVFTSGETLEIVLYKDRNNVNIFVDR